MFELDAEVLGLKYELIQALSDAGFAWFKDFTDVEADMSNAELKVVISCCITCIEPTLKKFANKHHFARSFFASDRGAYYLKRRPA